MESSGECYTLPTVCDMIMCPIEGRWVVGGQLSRGEEKSNPNILFKLRLDMYDGDERVALD